MKGLEQFFSVIVSCLISEIIMLEEVIDKSVFLFKNLVF